MHIGQALDLVSRYDCLRNPLTSLDDYLDQKLISRCLEESGTFTLRQRRLPLEISCTVLIHRHQKSVLRFSATPRQQ